MAFRQCPGSGPVWEARRALDLSRPEFEALSGIGTAALRNAELAGTFFHKAALVRRFNRAVPPELRVRRFFKTRADGNSDVVVSARCEKCGAIFETTPDKQKRGGGRYCTSECFNQTRIKRVLFTCACGCGETGETTPYALKRSKNLFINQAHRTQWYHRKSLPKLATSNRVLGPGLTKAIEAGSKFCPSCQMRKSINDFGPDKLKRDGKNPYCRACRAAAAREQKRRKKERNGTQ